MVTAEAGAQPTSSLLARRESLSPDQAKPVARPVGCYARCLRRFWRGHARVCRNGGPGKVPATGRDAAGVQDATYRSNLGEAVDGVFELMVRPVRSVSAECFSRLGAIAERGAQWVCEGRLAALAAEEGLRLGDYRGIER